MFFSILKWVIISLTLIFLVHHLYIFLMNTLTVPKIKDLVNKPTQQYQAMLGPASLATPPLNTMGDDPVTGAPLSDELSSFLNDLKKKNVPSAAGPSAAGPSAAGPSAAGSSAAGSNTDKFPSTLGSMGGEMGYSLY
jgi:hypothetical protein